MINLEDVSASDLENISLSAEDVGKRIWTAELSRESREGGRKI